MDPDEPVLDSPTGWVSRHIRRYLDSDGADGATSGAPASTPCC